MTDINHHIRYKLFSRVNKNIELPLTLSFRKNIVRGDIDTVGKHLVSGTAATQLENIPVVIWQHLNTYRFYNI